MGQGRLGRYVVGCGGRIGWAVRAGMPMPNLTPTHALLLPCPGLKAQPRSVRYWCWVGHPGLGLPTPGPGPLGQCAQGAGCQGRVVSVGIRGKGTPNTQLTPMPNIQPNPGAGGRLGRSWWDIRYGPTRSPLPNTHPNMPMGPGYRALRPGKPGQGD